VYASSLVFLPLPTIQVTNITPGPVFGGQGTLASLTNLTHLSLISNRIKDISPLASLTNLGTLTLNWNQISDVSPLASLTNLTDVLLTGNPLTQESINVHLPNLRGTIFEDLSDSFAQ
jgi:internalin A